MRREMDHFKEQLEKMRKHPGFIAALDQSGGSTPHALRAYGIKDDAWTSEEQMFTIVHQMRTRIMTSPAFTGERIIGAILFENTMDREVDSTPTADYLWDVKRVVPFESGQGPGGGEPRCPVDEADARPGGSAGQGQGQADLRNQDALVHQACRRCGDQGHRDPAVRSRAADYCRGARPDRRARSGHSLPGEAQGRRATQSGHPG